MTTENGQPGGQPEEMIDLAAFTAEEMLEIVGPDEDYPDWEQQPGEPIKWFTRFTKYLLAGPNRKLLHIFNEERKAKWPKDEAGNLVNYKPALAVDGAWLKQAKDWGWRERAELWDKAQAKELREKWEKRQEDLREAEFATAQKLLDRAKEMLEYPIVYQRIEEDKASGQLQTVIIPAKWSFRDVPAMVEMFSKLGRLASGLETDRKNGTQTLQGPDGEPLNLGGTTQNQVLIVLPSNGRDGLNQLESEDNQILEGELTSEGEPEDTA